MEDSVACLAPARKAGMRTVLVSPTLTTHPHATEVTADINAWLRAETA